MLLPSNWSYPLPNPHEDYDLDNSQSIIWWSIARESQDIRIYVNDISNQLQYTQGNMHQYQIDGSVQDCSNSIANALKLLQSHRMECRSRNASIKSINRIISTILSHKATMPVDRTCTLLKKCIVGNNMMTSSNTNFFRVTGPLWVEFTGHQWIPLTKASDAELWSFLWSAPERLSKQSGCRWFTSPLHLLWRHCNEISIITLVARRGHCQRMTLQQWVCLPI